MHRGRQEALLRHLRGRGEQAGAPGGLSGSHDQHNGDRLKQELINMAGKRLVSCLTESSSLQHDLRLYQSGRLLIWPEMHCLADKKSQAKQISCLLGNASQALQCMHAYKGLQRSTLWRQMQARVHILDLL